MSVIRHDGFASLLAPLLGEYYDRGLQCFLDYGDYSAFAVTYVLTQAVEPNRVEEVLDILEAHFAEHLADQDLEDRGRLTVLNVNPTTQMFMRICTEVLKLEEAPLRVAS